MYLDISLKLLILGATKDKNMMLNSMSQHRTKKARTMSVVLAFLSYNHYIKLHESYLKTFVVLQSADD